MFTLEHKWVIIQAYKHNEELHRQWSHSYVLVDDENYYVLVSIRAAVVESDGRKWHTKEPAIFILSKKEWFNAIAMLKENGICYYVNIASPAIYDKGYIKYIDYDLDIKVFEDGTYKVLDLNEFENHANSLNYPEEIKKILKEELEGLIKKIENKESPFNKEYIMNLYNKYKNERNNNRR